MRRQVKTCNGLSTTIDLKVRLAAPLDKSNPTVQSVVRRHVGQRSNGGTCVYVVVREWTNTMPETSHSLGTTPAHSPTGEISMKATRLYRIASVLLFVVAVGNTYGLLNFWHVAAPMPPVRFPIGHADFSYAQVVLGYQVFCSMCILFAAYLAWHLAALARTTPRAIGAAGWILFTYQILGVCISWMFFSGVVWLLALVIAVCIGWATWLVTADRQFQRVQSERALA
jgi:hypothetical protein